MTATRPRPLIAGNWKMNGLLKGVGELEAIASGIAGGGAGHAETLICPPFTLIARFAAAAAGQHIKIGAQDCHAKPSGAHTGDISAEMLKDCGASYVIVGHSERRTDHGETDADVKAKAEAAQRAGIIGIICIGETRAERESGKALEVVDVQLAGSLPPGATGANVVIAYEPVWAIGTGLTPTTGDIKEVHDFIRAKLIAALGEEGHNVRILYGGSCKPSNAAELMGVDNVDGALVGGASLKAADFLGIAAAYRG
ncbi:triosephosphate isomerase [Labrys miyagiensis]|uniref:Triosephosphate isomerase n=1 Tax=Labrys miyagiensis TaxID=346912 RepID=A0ABQ6CNL9_9HYPH|nr:triose-phosphate isomerase [Labrys miyagiensis]GLS20515.1 triosephosphate isomerase [Labrys miyagiensis]